MLLEQTNTPFVNLHLAPTVEDYPDMPLNTFEPSHSDIVTERMIQDVYAVTEVVGPERVIVENDHAVEGLHLSHSFTPEVIGHVIEETGCGFLLDVSHAHLAANQLKIDVHEYIRALPVEHIREIHVTGIQRFEGHWLEAAQLADADSWIIKTFAGKLLEHLPITSEDWDLFEWVLEQVHAGLWGRPWVITFEYGGVGPLWEAITDKDVLADQVPKLWNIVKEGPLD